MNDNRSFLITLLLAVGSGVVIGLFVFGLTGRSPPPVPAADGNQATSAARSAPSPSTSAEPMAPVQYDDAGSTGDAIPSPAQTAEAPRKVLM